MPQLLSENGIWEMNQDIDRTNGDSIITGDFYPEAEAISHLLSKIGMGIPMQSLKTSSL